MKETIGFKRLTGGATIPYRAHDTDSGYDLFASEDVIIEPGESAIVPTGIAVQLPEGTEAQVRPRSGVTSRTKLRVQLGTIDNSYRGDIGVIVDNIMKKSDYTSDNYLARLIGVTRGRVDTVNDGKTTDRNTYLIRKHDKIAQLVIQYLPKVEAREVRVLENKGSRGTNGFGSSGI